MNIDRFRGDVCSWDRAALDNYLFCAASNIDDLRRKMEIVRQEINYREEAALRHDRAR